MRFDPRHCCTDMSDPAQSSDDENCTGKQESSQSTWSAPAVALFDDPTCIGTTASASPGRSSAACSSTDNYSPSNAAAAAAAAAAASASAGEVSAASACSSSDDSSSPDAILLSDRLLGLNLYGINQMVPKEFSRGFCLFDPDTSTEDFDGQDSDENFAKAFSRFQIATARGDGKINKLSKLYEHAARYFQAAAKNGHVRSQYMLAVCYVCGLGVVQDRARACNWFKKAAAQGQPDAQSYLVLLLSGPQSSADERAQAKTWFKLSHAQHPGRVAFFMHANLQRVRHRASNAAEECATHNCRCYFDESEDLRVYSLDVCGGCAKELLVDVVSQQLPHDHSGWVQLVLGIAYFVGIGVPCSRVMARRWWKRGAALGNLLAQDQLEMLPVATTCDVCKGTFDRVEECARCFSRAYCSVECQEADWMERHKNECATKAKDIIKWY